MFQTVTITELLRNPKYVEDLVKKGVKVNVLKRGEVVMVITLPENEYKTTSKPPVLKSGIKNYTITREDIYDEDSWLDK
jgi:antitoxin (DNA-binding transcriptional repressor) of toxin-antitoxin stability system